jgi:hypothetical protein
MVTYILTQLASDHSKPTVSNRYFTKDGDIIINRYYLHDGQRRINSTVLGAIIISLIWHEVHSRLQQRQILLAKVLQLLAVLPQSLLLS